MEPTSLQKDELEEIRNGGNNAIKEIYKSGFVYCTTYIIKNGGNQEDAREIFQQSMVVFLEKLHDEAFVLNSTVKKYLSGICRNQWLKELKRRGKIELLSTDTEMNQLGLVEEVLPAEDETPSRIQQVFQHLNIGSEACKRILHLTFFNKLSDKEIAPIMDYTLEFVRNKRRRCIASIRKKINQDHG